jgi:teichuronic acid biosynthesis glycosyltransferase TuaH
MSSVADRSRYSDAAAGPNAAPPAEVVFTFSRVTWQAAWRRGFYHSEDRLALSLVESERIGRLLVGNHNRHAAARLARRLTGADRAQFPETERIALVEPVSLRHQDPVTVAGAERAYRAYDRALERAARRHGLQHPHIITGNPLLAGFAPLEWAESLTWYAVDDWAEHPAYHTWSAVFRESYVRVRERGCRVAAVSRPLLERLDPTGPAAVIANGVDPAEWAQPRTVPLWIRTLPRPIFLYVGTLDARIDVAQVRALAAAQSTGTILFVGPLADADHLAPLRDLPNVQIRPQVPRGEVAGLVRAADVGLLPHVASPLTRAMSPLKLLEYLAAGLPVVATDLEPVREFADQRVMLVPAGGDIGAAAASAAAAGRASETRRLAFLDEHSWRSRHDRLLDLALG